MAALIEDVQQLVNGKIPLHVRHKDEPPALRPKRYKLIGDMAHGRVRLAHANRASQQKQPALLGVNADGLAQNPLNPRALPSFLRFRHTYLQSFLLREQGAEVCSGCAFGKCKPPRTHPVSLFARALLIAAVGTRATCHCSPSPVHRPLFIQPCSPVHFYRNHQAICTNGYL